MPEYPPLTLGIDPGSSGGLAFIGTGFVEVCAIPDTERDIVDAIREYAGSIKVCCIEAVHPMPKRETDSGVGGQGNIGSFKLGRSYGFLRGVIIALGIPLIEVSPQKWKNDLGLRFTKEQLKTERKNASKQLAQQWFPSIRITHAVGEALLIGEWARRQNGWIL